MQQDLDIFESGRPQSGKFFYHKNVGDSIQGTYIDVREGRDTYGNDQNIYVLKDKNGEVWNVGVRKTNTFLNEKMRGVKLGQIIGFKFDEERESTKSPTGKMKVIRIYEDPQIVDQEWIDQRNRLSALYADAAPAVATHVVASNAPAPTDVAPVAPPLPVDKVAAPAAKVSDSVQAVRNLAITKGLTEEVMTPDAQDAAIAAYVGVPVTDANMAQVVIKLAEYKRA